MSAGVDGHDIQGVQVSFDVSSEQKVGGDVFAGGGVWAGTDLHLVEAFRVRNAGWAKNAGFLIAACLLGNRPDTRPPRSVRPVNVINEDSPVLGGAMTYELSILPRGKVPIPSRDFAVLA